MNVIPYDIPAGKLPSIEIYGGDTAPWILNVTDRNGNAYTEEDLANCSFELDVVPYNSITFEEEGRLNIEPVISLTGTLSIDADGYAVAQFVFPREQTLSLFGRYTYQIDISNGSEHRILQGRLTIKRNVNAL